MRLSGFHGGNYKYALSIRGADTLEDAAAYVVDGIFISHNSCNVKVYGMTFTGEYLSGYGIGVSESAVASIISSTVKNCRTGILAGRWGSDSCGIIMGDSTVKFENNTTNLLKYNVGCQIFGMGGME